MAILVTGAAGFIGYHVCKTLLACGEEVVGIDNINDYYDVRLKEARLSRLQNQNGFSFHRVDISDLEALKSIADGLGDVNRVIHLAAQAGVRYSIENPFAYVQANLVGQMAILEFCRHQPNFEHLVYASSSSVYGGNTKLPFSVYDRTDTPVSLYAATKKADELMSHCYGHLYGFPQTGLRFFTVYGPWGRPDMAMYIFCKAISEGRPIPVFNNGDMKRDFTYIDDIVSGVIASLDNPPKVENGNSPCRLYNIGNHRSEPLMRMIELIEGALGKKAEIDFQPMQPGDVKESFADIDAITADLGYAPTTPIDIGVPKFVDWFKSYEGV
ncbi:MAG: protein CapI [Rhodospirillaceae bacterium]|nr:protein CapI [Rhodospirillaceae bacterium]|tara:strand:- start:22933 stop:23913 length:981 start_codon:yes stop_codon:yes gene_type:complete